MSETEFLIGRSGLDLVDDFYPDDLPNEWRFDYYSTLFKTLSLPIDTQEDLDSIFEELQDSDEEFELVLSIDDKQLTNAKTLAGLLDPVSEYRSMFVLFCELNQQLNTDVMALLKGYRVAFQSDELFKMDYQTKQVAGKHLYYSHIPVLYTSSIWNEKQMRTYVEQAAVINARSILICKNAESEALNKIRVIAEILGF
ncbi:hypothetical protein [uncultured Gammaproteobacteria bacterium]|uniref:hypothetical protein n=1 Tax=Bathymodiolus heckerae thiotrophic gill symbiont TaxID=1052212 RepID=UPI0010B1CCA8|nr:hypothetical protein [Bathymodiolus heckerae thiotrophic gill symbiont]CAC9602050.1 hypothetical protein [uncultured Gammaproteobacteria bacterium]SHN90143.1 hypothetical protein BHECKSOX_330 [Bathymodiolus heckerae thiotrophic gill symbiont]